MPRTLSIQDEESSKDIIGLVWLVVLVGVAEWGMMGTCQPMNSP